MPILGKAKPHDPHSKARTLRPGVPCRPERQPSGEEGGVRPKTVGQIGGKLLTEPKIKEAIQEPQIQISTALEVTQGRIVAELAKIGFANMLDFIKVQDNGDVYVDLSTVTRDQAAAIAR